MLKGDVEKYKIKTEYEVSKIVEKWLRDDRKKCQRCGSPFLEASNIKIEDYSLFDYDKLSSNCIEKNDELFVWTIRKIFPTVTFDRAGKVAQEPVFVRECFSMLINLVEQSTEDKFIFNERMGDLFICFTGKYEFDKDSFNPIIERFYSTGLRNDEVIKCINMQLSDFGFHDLIKEF